MTQTRKRWPCGVCQSNVPDGGIKCDACQKWHHADCVDGIDSEDLAYLKRKKLKMHWYCRLCDSSVTEILSNFEKFKKFNIEVKKMKDEMDKKYSEMAKRLEKMEKDKTQTANNINQRIEQQIENLAAQNLNQVDLEEQKNIENRKTNLILFGVPESVEEELADRLESDFLKVNDILAQKTEITRNEIQDIFRIGKKNDRHRPLLIKLCDEEAKTRVLRASKDLQVIVNHEVKPVFVNVDRTPKQREKFKELRAELKKRTDDGETGLIIRGYNIVKHQLFHAKRAARTRNIWAANCQKHEETTTEEPK